MLLLDYAFLKQTIPPLLLVFYLWSLKEERIKLVFNCFVGVFYVSGPLVFILTVFGIDVVGIIDNSWRTWVSPFQYYFFMLIMFKLFYNITKDVSFSFTCSVHMGILSGYLYEIPRYFKLQGLWGLIRFNRYSFFIVDYAILSGFVVSWILYDKGFRFNVDGFLLLVYYIFYNFFYYVIFEWVLYIKHFFAYVGGVRVPFIFFYRLPTMIFLLLVTTKCSNKGLK